MKKVIVITGIGGIGLAITRRIGAGFRLLLCDFNKANLDKAAEELSVAGYDVTTAQIDVSDQQSVENVAKQASEAGEIYAVVHTAGLSPNTASAEQIIDVNLIGTARILEAFEPYLSVGTCGVFISSSSAYLGRELTPEQIRTVTAFSAKELKDYVPALEIKDANDAYVISKRLNQFQVAVAAIRWGKKNARVMSVSPGVISTPMGIKERQSSSTIDYMLANSPVQRIGIPEDIAGVLEFILSPAGSFLSGTDILVDGGVVAFLKNGTIDKSHFQI
ncbi:MAG: SDR family oxidoreductase [Chitinophagaceae bacterium]